MKTLFTNAPGVALCAVLAAYAWFTGRAFPMLGGPVAGILLGLAASALMTKSPRAEAGVRYTSKKILQYAVILLGFGMNFFDVLSVGSRSLLIIICTIAAALIAAAIGSRLLGLRDRSAVLIGVGTCICGGSAIAAAAPCIGASDEEIARSISTIFLFNIIAAFLFPALGGALGMTNDGFGIWAGTAVNDTSSVVAASQTWDSIHGNTANEALNLATIVKLTRTLAIIPITIVLTLITARGGAEGSGGGGFNFVKVFPWFVVFFALAAVVNTFAPLPPELPKALVTAGKFFITMAMTAIGLNTDLVKLIKGSSRGMALGLICWFAVAAVSLGIQRAQGSW